MNNNQNERKDLAIVVPIYNPCKDWESQMLVALHQVEKIFSCVNLEIVIVNDGSSICLKKAIEQIQLAVANCSYVHYNENQGKGYAIRQGLQTANATYYIYTDWDFPFGVSILKKIYDDLKHTQSDLIIAKRDKTYFKQLPFSRKLVSFSLKTINFFLLNYRKIDTQAGIKGLNENAKNVFLNIKTKNFVFEIEFIQSCIRKKLKISCQPVTPRKGIKFSNFKPQTLIKELQALAKIALIPTKNESQNITDF